MQIPLGRNPTTDGVPCVVGHPISYTEIVSTQTLALLNFGFLFPLQNVLPPYLPITSTLPFFLLIRPCSGVPPCCIHQLKLSSKPITSFHLVFLPNSKTAYHTSSSTIFSFFLPDPSKSNPCSMSQSVVPTNSKSIFHPITSPCSSKPTVNLFRCNNCFL
jgi:hypothetical protein